MSSPRAENGPRLGISFPVCRASRGPTIPTSARCRARRRAGRSPAVRCEASGLRRSTSGADPAADAQVAPTAKAAVRPAVRVRTRRPATASSEPSVDALSTTVIVNPGTATSGSTHARSVAELLWLTITTSTTALVDRSASPPDPRNTQRAVIATSRRSRRRRPSRQIAPIQPDQLRPLSSAVTAAAASSPSTQADARGAPASTGRSTRPHPEQVAADRRCSSGRE